MLNAQQKQAIVSDSDVHSNDFTRSRENENKVTINKIYAL